MSALSLSQNYTAVGPEANFVQFLASGGSPPYTYSVVAGGAGGSINNLTGAYLAPNNMTAYPATGLIDTITVIDSLSNQVSSTILIGSPLFLFCDIIQKYMGIPNDHIYLWDQKVFQPVDSNLYIAISVDSCKPYSNINTFDSSGNSVQYVNMYNVMGIEAISRGPAARDQKELIIAALNSTYSEQQQEANGFYIGKISTGFHNLSHIDGAAIPYRFRINCAMQYSVKKTTPNPYFNTFESPMVYNN